MLSATIRLALVLALGAQCSSTPVPVQTNDDTSRCATETDPDLIIDHCSRAIGSESLSTSILATSLASRGAAYLKKHVYDRAIQDYDQAIQLQPNFAQAFYNRGLAYYYKSEYERAIADFDEAIRLKPDYAIAFDASGNLYNSKGDNDQAVQNYDEAIRLKPDYAPIYYNRGNAYLAEKEYERAIQDYNEAIRLKPDFQLAIHNRGVVYRDMEDFARAIQDLDESIRLDPKDALAFCNRGNIYAAQGKYDRAIHEYDESIRLNPGDGITFYARGNTYASKGDYKRALRDLNEAIHLQPEYKAFLSRGAVQFEQGHFAASVPDLTMSAQLAPSDIYVAMWLYLARARAGLNPEEALSSAQKLESKSWPSPLISLYRGEVLPKAVMEAAATPDPKEQRSQMCDAYFYVAEYNLLRGLRDEATRELQASLDGCPLTTLEYRAAKADLKRLAQ